MNSDRQQYLDDEMLDALYRRRRRTADERFGNGNRMAAPHLFSDDPQRRLEQRIGSAVTC